MTNTTGCWIYRAINDFFSSFIDIIVHYPFKEACVSWPQLCYVVMSLVEPPQIFDYIVRVVKFKLLLTCSCSVNSNVTLPYTLTQFKMHFYTFIREHNRWRKIKLIRIDILYFVLNKHDKVTLDIDKFISSNQYFNSIIVYR